MRIGRLFQEIEPKCGLLNRLSSGEIEFCHLTFQEFLAARHLVNMELDYRKFLAEEWWEETLILHIGYINLNMKKRSNNMVEEILNTVAENHRNRNRLWLLGAKTLRDFQPSQREEKAVALAREKLLRLIDPGAGLKERFEAGEILGILGDPRLNEEKMILVMGGKFKRGSNEWDNAKPVKEIELDDFWIGKYPVTNMEFRGFVEAGGYQDREWWSPESWEWREKEKICEPKFWHDRRWNGPNFPVVGVSWYEAEAFASWLKANTGINYRLPAEAEWEKAARGTNGLKYPWGDRFQSKFCNSRESGLMRISPVGIFPTGKSPYGCLDLAGNVWEWCADWYDSGYYKQSPSKNPPGPISGSGRVLRGGCWFFGAEFCAAAYRFYLRPVYRVDNLGFRLARS